MRMMQIHSLGESTHARRMRTGNKTQETRIQILIRVQVDVEVIVQGVGEEDLAVDVRIVEG